MGCCASQPRSFDQRTPAQVTSVIAPNLLNSVKELLSLLYAVDTVNTASAEGLYDAAVLLEALRRYETFWLPLIAVADNAEYRVADLVPPLDIAWVWYIHRLNPTAYKNDLLQAFKFVPAPSHTPGPNNPRALPRLNLSDAQFMALVQQTEAVWARRYPTEPYSPAGYFLAPSPAHIPAVAMGFRSRFSTDIIGSAQRQKEFIAHVFSPFILNNIHNAIIRYVRFVLLAKKNMESAHKMVPLYDIDLVWHAHMACHLDYYNFTSMLRFPPNCVLSHDDTFSDRTPGSAHQTSYAFTKQSYEKTFKTKYEINPHVKFKGTPMGPRALDPNLSIGSPPPWPVRPYQPYYGLPRVAVPVLFYTTVVPAAATSTCCFGSGCGGGGCGSGGDDGGGGCGGGCGD